MYPEIKKYFGNIFHFITLRAALKGRIHETSEHCSTTAKNEVLRHNLE
jgi:hypothetical protein